jgi:hypothetical protein
LEHRSSNCFLPIILIVTCRLDHAASGFDITLLVVSALPVQLLTMRRQIFFLDPLRIFVSQNVASTIAFASISGGRHAHIAVRLRR